MTNSQSTQLINFSDFSKIAGFHTVYIKRDNGNACGWDGLHRSTAFDVLVGENIFTIDGRLIANRIS